MKTLFSSLLLSVLLALQAGPAAAETTLAGKWQGWLEVQPGRTMAIQFVITAARVRESPKSLAIAASRRSPASASGTVSTR